MPFTVQQIVYVMSILSWWEFGNFFQKSISLTKFRRRKTTFSCPCCVSDSCHWISWSDMMSLWLFDSHVSESSPPPKWPILCRVGR